MATVRGRAALHRRHPDGEGGSVQAGQRTIMPFKGVRVLALESRRSAETAELIRKQGGVPFVAPSMREVPVSSNDAVFAFAERLYAGGFDMMILLTGVGTRQLARVLDAGRFAAALRKLTDRGARPQARRGPARDGTDAGDRCAGAEHLARTAAGDRRTAGAADRDPGIRPVQSGTDRGAAGAGRGSDSRPRVSVRAARGSGAFAGSGAPAGRRAASKWSCSRPRCRSST